MSVDELETDPDRLVLREEWFQLCDEDVYGALILEQMIRWQTWIDDQEGREWIEKSARDLSEDLGGLAGRTTCSKRLKSLEGMGVLQSRSPDNPKSSKQWRVDFETLRERAIDAGYDYDAIHSDRVRDMDTSCPRDGHEEGERVHETDTARPRNGHDASTRRTRRVRETDRSKKTNNKDVHTSTSESAPACEDPEPEPNTDPPADDLAADGGSEIEDETDNSEADDPPDTPFDQFIIQEARKYGWHLNPAGPWHQVRAAFESGDEARAWVERKLSALDADSRDFDARTVTSWLQEDARDGAQGREESGPSASEGRSRIGGWDEDEDDCDANDWTTLEETT